MSSEVELIKSRILPSEIIAKKVQLKNRGGTDYVGLCPFHREKTPSFFVNDDKGIIIVSDVVHMETSLAL